MEEGVPCHPLAFTQIVRSHTRTSTHVKMRIYIVTETAPFDEFQLCLMMAHPQIPFYGMSSIWLYLSVALRKGPGRSVSPFRAHCC